MYTRNLNMLHLSAKFLLFTFSYVFPTFAEVIPRDSQLYLPLCCSCYCQNSLPDDNIRRAGQTQLSPRKFSIYPWNI